MTKREFIDRLWSARRQGTLSNDQELLNYCRELAKTLGIEFDPLKVEGLINAVNGLDGDQFLEISDKIGIGEVDKQPETKLTRDKLEILLEDLSKHELSLENPEEVAKQIQNDNPWLKNTNSQEIIRIIKRKAEIEREKKDKLTEKQVESIVKIEEEARKRTQLKEEEIRLVAEDIVESRKISRGETEIQEIKTEFEVDARASEARKTLIEEISQVVPELRGSEGEIDRITTRLIAGEVRSDEAEREVAMILSKKGVAAEVVNLRSREVVVGIEKGVENNQIIEEQVEKQIERRIVEEIEGLNENLTQEQKTAIRMYAQSYTTWNRETPKAEVTVNEVMSANQGEARSEQITQSQAELYKTHGETLQRVVYSNPDKFRGIEKLRTNLESKGVKIPERIKSSKNFESFDRVVKIVNSNPTLTRTLAAVQRWQVFQSSVQSVPRKISGYVLTKLGVEGAAKAIAAKSTVSIGGKALSIYVRQTSLAISRYGFEKGIGIAIKTAASRVAARAAAGSLTKIFSSGVVAILGGASGPPGWLVTAVLFGVDLAIGLVRKITGLVTNNIKKVLQKLNLWSAESEAWFKKTFGKGMGGIMNWGFQGSMMAITALLSIPALIGAVVIIPIWMILVPLLVPSLYNHFQTASTQVSQMVASKGVGGGTCVKKSDVFGSSTTGVLADCDVNAPTTDAINVNKSLFVNVAERWRKGGAVNAERCYYDVVCKAKNAGINPDFALWAWLHESGASNYSGFSPTKIEDFGIHYLGEAAKNNFNTQINEFLKLDPASSCLNDPRVGGNYWLSFAISYLNGSEDCNPDKPNVDSGQTPRQYLAEMTSTWSWINPNPMPDSIKISPESCGGGTSTTSEYTDTSGETYICEGDTDIAEGAPAIALPTRDPSIPIPEECPGGWPLSVKACITQGSYGGFSHKVIEAMDFAGGCVDKNIVDSEIRATHSGVAVGGGSEASPYGYFVDVTSKCNGVTFTTRYAHMPNIIIQQNSVVKRGDLLGYVDNSGTFRAPGNEHLHYEILWQTLKLNDFVPQPVPNGCYGWQSCGSVIINK